MELTSTSRDEIIQENLLKLKYKVQEQRLETVWNKFVKAGFSPILIKGWAAALKYPNPFERLYVDLDLIFETNEFEKAEKFVKENSFELLIDLHNGARHLDSLKFNHLFANCIFKSCGKSKIRILSEEDHLRILCVHWLNDGGMFKERLWDIFYAVENRKLDFDWDKCLNVVNSKRRKWIISAIGITHRFLNLRIDDLPFKDEFKDIPNWVFKAVEKEWEEEVKLLPLHIFLNDKKQLWKQIKKRIPPNPIQATIEVNGSFNKTPRIFYQMADIFKRTLPSWKRIRERLKIGGL